MKKLFLWGGFLLIGASSCRNQCPAYSATKPVNRVAAPIMASTAPVAEHQ
ncbi:hypothetical protein ACFPAF_19135 [Hymenobacter endophyticus]|uniref:Lipoprotein n=1 Tax=Hymenobacter endophyticus TaxID=3076335 RepID=A0ABU3TMB0_9BACT|nr:hypothetical protein [Hymenobacter endophyticus]MDU0372523.1 hypothetical protein [Hymenobacter endophyticus]